jgi:hypothetical protein
VYDAGVDVGCNVIFCPNVHATHETCLEKMAHNQRKRKVGKMIKEKAKVRMEGCVGSVLP